MKRLFNVLLVILLSSLVMSVSAMAYDMGKAGESQTISAGNGHSAAIIGGNLWTWGDNRSKQLGDGTFEKRLLPVKVMDDVSSVNAGMLFTLALKTDRTLWSCGFNLGEVEINPRPSIKIMDNCSAVYCGTDLNMALKADGSLWGWGFNHYDIIGETPAIKGEDNKTTYQIFKEPHKIMDTVSAVSAQSTYAMVIKKDGSLWAWGSNSIGLLGDGTAQDRKSPVKIMENVIAISTASAHVMAIKADGSLWGWGDNYDGRLGDGTVNRRISPVKIMDDISSVSASTGYTMAIKKDGTLWSWGANNGALGFETTAPYERTPVKIMDNVAAVSAGQYHAMALKKDGSLWAWGKNQYGEVGDGTNVKRVTPVRIMDCVTLPENLSLTKKLADVSDKESGVKAIQSAAFKMTIDQKSAPTEVDLITLFAEEVVAQATSTFVQGNRVVVNKDTLTDPQMTAADIKKSAIQALVAADIHINREMNVDIKFKTVDNPSVTIVVYPSAAEITANNVRVETPNYAVSIPADVIKEYVGDSPFTITISKDASSSDEAYSVTFNKKLNMNIKISMKPKWGEPTYQAIKNSAGTVVGGKFNPITKMLTARIKESDIYTVKENLKHFSDIICKSSEMQEAILVLSSKGVIDGSSATEFNPDNAITRAEISALVIRILSKGDPDADGCFKDVAKKDWYYSAVSSAKKYGIINGTTQTMFEPNSKILKEQIVAIAARTLSSEMRYKNPANAEELLKTFADRSTMPSWGTDDFALATRENLVVKRSDGKFNGSDTMTRGDAAIILYRLFNKIW